MAVARALAQGESSQASYTNVIAQFGNVEPFNQIAKAEADLISALRTVAQAHGIAISGDPLSGSPAAPTIALACVVGVEIQKFAITLYDELLPQVTAYPDATTALANLRTAAKDTYLPEFRRCS